MNQRLRTSSPITNNNISTIGPSAYGAFLSSSSNNNTLTGNSVSSNAQNGIYVAYSSDNNFAGNKATGNPIDFNCGYTFPNNDLGGNTCSTRDSCYWVNSCACTATGNACHVYKECCTNYCSGGGRCACKPATTSCSYDFECCSGTCSGGSCG